jgi:hypothetical protein
LLLGENSPQTPRKTHARTQDFFTERDKNIQDFFAQEHTQTDKISLQETQDWQNKQSDHTISVKQNQQNHLRDISKADQGS